MSIEFFYEETNFILDQQVSIKNWLLKTIETEGYKTESLNYIFCSDEYLHKINLQYLKHDTLTDIITFDNSELENTIDSDIFISIDRVQDNCNSQSINFGEELARVMVHGVLHLMGWNDKTEELKKAMRKKEDTCLNLL